MLNHRNDATAMEGQMTLAQQTAIAAIDKMTTREELDAISRYARSKFNRMVVSDLNQIPPGTRVKFDARSRGIVHGVLTGYNRKTANVTSDYGMKWRVAYSLIRRENA